MKKKLLLIDIDDTICNSSEAYKKALKKCYLFLKRKYPILDEKTFIKNYEKARKEIHSKLKGTASMHNRFLYFQKMFENFGFNIKPDTLDEITEIYWSETCKNLKLFSHVKETLKIVKENNIKVGVVSNLLADVQIKKLKKLKISQYIDFIVTSEEAGKEKPDKPIFLLALREANAKPSETIMVGNSIEDDVIGANKAGITSVLFSKTKNKKADFTINDFKELLKILKIKKKTFRNRKMVVFDLMGGLFDEPHIIKNVLSPLMKNKISYKKLKKIYEKYSLGRISQREFQKTVPEYIEKEAIDSVSLKKDMIKTIKWLRKKKYMLGILSNIPEPWGEYWIEKFKLKKYFDTIVFSGTYGKRKPDEELYRIFVEKAKIKPENCYFIDDKLENLKEARFFLMKTIWRQIEKQDLSFIPDFIIKKPGDLRRIF